jgi:HrpA-like RNA helicase
MVTEPRQINASSIAEHVAEEQGKLGEEIDLAHGDAKESSSNDNMSFATEGILLMNLL